jgi:hypothetical protein
MRKKLAPPKNFRMFIPPVCFFCRWYAAKEEGWFCDREGYDGGRKTFGADKSAPFRHTCDRWRWPTKLDHLVIGD